MCVCVCVCVCVAQHALTINTEIWGKFPFRNVPFDVSVHLVNKQDSVTHGYEVSLGVDLVYADNLETARFILSNPTGWASECAALTIMIFDY